MCKLRSYSGPQDAKENFKRLEKGKGSEKGQCTWPIQVMVQSYGKDADRLHLVNHSAFSTPIAALESVWNLTDCFNKMSSSAYQPTTVLPMTG